MYIVIGNSPKKILLKDLNDCIYYKQQKVFTDAQYAHSSELRRAIDKGLLIVVRKSEDRAASFNLSAHEVAPEIKQDTVDNSKIDQLLDRIKGLENSLSKQNQSHKSVDSDLLSAILSRLDLLEKKVPSEDLTSIKDAIGKLETKLQEDKRQEQKTTSTSNDALVEQLQNIIRTSGKEVVKKKEEKVIPEEIYIPNIRVEDAKSHINLQVRNIDTGDSVSDSLKKLKELRSKSK